MTDPHPDRDAPPPPGSLGVNVPQRYAVNHERYAARGGLVRPGEDIGGFIAAEDNRSDMARFWFFCLAFDQIVKEDLRGDFAELGVYRGHTASLLAIMARRRGTTAHLLDTFAGFSQADLKGIDEGVDMGFADTSVEAVRALVGEPNVRFVQGHFPSSAAQLPDDASYCLVHLDCDLYAPMASALAYFYPRLVPGGFLIVHDYSSLHWDGAEKAVHEFLADKSESAVPLPDSGGSVVIRKARPPARFDNWYVRRNAALFGPEWTEAAMGNLAAVLGDGWSTPEEWGVWGMGPAHQIHVFLDAPPRGTIEIEFDVAARLLENGTRRNVEVFAGGRCIQTWSFGAEENRSFRTLSIPVELFPQDDNALPSIPVEFRPMRLPAASDLLSQDGDQRSLGVALHRLRRKS